MKMRVNLIAILLIFQALPLASQHALARTARDQPSPQSPSERDIQWEDDADGRRMQLEYVSLYSYSPRRESYSVDQISETIKTLADGNQVKTRESSTRYRDSKGRVRIVYKSFQGNERIFIGDPVVGHAHLIRPNRNDILRLTGAPSPMRMVPNPGRTIRPHEWSRKVETSLGMKEIEGVQAIGSITETFYLAGAKGNEKEMVETREIWSDGVLPGYLYVRDSSPQTGDRIRRFENLKFGDVPDTLFAIPDGMPIRDIVVDSSSAR